MTINRFPPKKTKGIVSILNALRLNHVTNAYSKQQTLK